MMLSIVIPTLNEEENIITTLRTAMDHCADPGGCEIIMVDGGSTDRTSAVARALAPEIETAGGRLHVLNSPCGRARQMNHGAEHACGDILLFLHADTILPDNYDICIKSALDPEQSDLGAFRLAADMHTPGMRWICWWANLRASLFSLPYGDQALFIRRRDFHRLGMFAMLEIMEDFAFVRTVKHHGGTIRILPHEVITSARRWQKQGFLLTTLCNQAILLGYLLQVPPRLLARWYRR